MNETTSKNQETEKISKTFELYEDYARGIETACQKGCCACCTTNVIVTGLEAAWLYESLDEEKKEEVKELVLASKEIERRIPACTINQMAELFKAGMEVPEDSMPSGMIECPFLSDGSCTIYPVRPFSCRSMSSTTRCATGTEAEMSPVTVTVNTVFMQFIEHMDKDGFSGNLIDMLHAVITGRFDETSGRFVQNRPIQVLVIPPEHRGQIRPFVDNLARIAAGM